MDPMHITTPEFAALGWIDQHKVLRSLNERSAHCTGKTIAEAERKRKPLDKRLSELQAITDAQKRAWINQASRIENEKD